MNGTTLLPPPHITAWRGHGEVYLSRGVKRKNFKVRVFHE
jgi:hypothetical protein